MIGVRGPVKSPALVGWLMMPTDMLTPPPFTWQVEQESPFLPRVFDSKICWPWAASWAWLTLALACCTALRICPYCWSDRPGSACGSKPNLLEDFELLHATATAIPRITPKGSKWIFRTGHFTGRHVTTSSSAPVVGCMPAAGPVCQSDLGETTSPYAARRCPWRPAAGARSWRWASAGRSWRWAAAVRDRRLAGSVLGSVLREGARSRTDAATATGRRTPAP